MNFKDSAYLLLADDRQNGYCLGGVVGIADRPNLMKDY